MQTVWLLLFALLLTFGGSFDNTAWANESHTKTPAKATQKATQKISQQGSKKGAPKQAVKKPGRKVTLKSEPQKRISAAKATAAQVVPDAAQAKALAQERSALQEKLAQLKRDIAAGESTRSEVADQLAQSERAISDVNRKLRDLDSQQARVQNQLVNIGQRQSETQSQIASQQIQLGQLLRQQYVAGSQDPFRLLFSGDDPNRVQRDLAYLGYVGQAQADMVRQLRGHLGHLHELDTQTSARNQELTRIAEAQEASRAALVKEQAARQSTLTSISSKLQAQRREAGTLERDEQRLGKVVEGIARALALQARQEQEKREREKKLREREQEQLRERQRQQEAAKKSGMPASAASRHEPDSESVVGSTSGPISGPAAASSSGAGSANGAQAPSAMNETNALTPGVGYIGNFAALKGQLRLPVRGELTARFGKARSDGGPSWKGIFIRAMQGADVKVIAPGRVVFAEWLRGFGNLLIVDHGNQYLSIYGNNEALLKQAGDTVQSGDVVATTGNSGGNPESGLYFELRFQGRPFDPLSWARLR